MYDRVTEEHLANGRRRVLEGEEQIECPYCPGAKSAGVPCLPCSRHIGWVSLDWYVGLFAGKLREEVLGEIVRIGRQVPIEHLQTVLMLLRAKQFEVLNSVGGAG